MLSVAELKAYIKKNRPVGLRPYSRLKKAELLKLAVEIGYPAFSKHLILKRVEEILKRVEEIQKGIPKYDPREDLLRCIRKKYFNEPQFLSYTPEERDEHWNGNTQGVAPAMQVLTTAPTKKNIRELLRIYVGQSSWKPVAYIARVDIENLFMLLYVLKKNSNDCHIKRNGNSDYGIQMAISKGRHSFEITNEKRVMIQKEYEKCKSRGKMLIIPLQLRYSEIGEHTNMLIFNFHRNELERFEPYGEMESEKAKGISQRIDDNLLLQLALPMGLKYVASTDVFSKKRLRKGFQWFEETLGYIQGQYVREDKYTIKDPWGFCTAWSYFYADIRLQYPSYSAADLTEEIYSVIGKDPNTLRAFIRGQMRFLEVEINKVNEHYPFAKFLEHQSNGDYYQGVKRLYQTYINKRFFELA